MRISAENRQGMARALQRRVLIPTPLNDLTEKIIQAAIAVHDALDPGLLESVYRRCLVVAPADDDPAGREPRVWYNRPVISGI